MHTELFADERAGSFRRRSRLLLRELQRVKRITITHSSQTQLWAGEQAAVSGRRPRFKPSGLNLLPPQASTTLDISSEPFGLPRCPGMPAPGQVRLISGLDQPDYFTAYTFDHCKTLSACFLRPAACSLELCSKRTYWMRLSP